MLECHEYFDILARLDRIRREWRSVRVLEGVLAFLILVVGIWTIFLACEAWLHLHAFVRQAMLLIAGATALVGLVTLIIRRMLEDRSEEQIALQIESVFPEAQNYLINAVRLGKEKIVTSPALVCEAIRESARETAGLNLRRAIDKRPLTRFGAGAALAILSLTALLVLFPGRIANAFARIVRPMADIPKIGAIKLKKVEPGDCVLPSGDTLTVRVTIEPSDRREISATLHWRPSGEEHKQQRMRLAGDDEFSGEIRDVKMNLRYRVEVGDTESEWYQVTVVERPAVAKIALKYEYPAYTGLPPKIVEDSDGNIQAVIGTLVDMQVHASKPVKEGSLRVEDKSLPLNLGIGRTVLTTRLTIKENQNYTIHLTDDLGNSNREPVLHFIRAEADAPPTVHIPEPGKDKTLTAGDSLTIVIRASDNFGMVSAELVAKKKGEEKEFVVKRWDDLDGKKQLSLPFEWLFDKTMYKNGETIRYFARVTDNNNVSGPGVGRSPEFQVHLEDIQVKKEETRRKYADWEQRLEALLKQQKAVRKETGRLLGVDKDENKK